MSGESGPVIASGPPLPPQPNGVVELRLEIRDLSQNQKLWTLYLLGLQAFQNLDTNAPMSYYQIAGIHGVPHIRWPDRDWNNMTQVSGTQFGGFCTHSSILFLPWHRPYLVLFEQAIFTQVIRIADELALELNDSSWLTEAQGFRLPYWDWADPRKGTFPDEALGDTVSIIQPGTQGQKKPMPNPLYAFNFASPDQDGNVNNAGATWRIAQDGDPVSVGKQLISQFKASFQQEAQQYQEKNLTERVIYILQGYSNYGMMSNDAFRGPGSPGTYGSLEGIHNTIHNVTGGGGNMSDPDVAAFDPIFWLHHCNIDRLFAIWQALHESDSDPSTYVQSEQAADGDFSTPAGGKEDATTDLTPFWKSQQHFYNSTDVKSTLPLGYAYPETQSWRFPDQNAYRTNIQQQLVQLYPAASLANSVREAKLPMAHMVTTSVPLLQARAKSHLQTMATSKSGATITASTRQLPKAAAPGTAKAGSGLSSSSHGLPQPVQPHHVPHAVDSVVHPQSTPIENHATNGDHTGSIQQPFDPKAAPLQTLPPRKIDDLVVQSKYLEWITNIKAKKHEFGRSYNVHIFLGDVPTDDSVLYPLAPSHVGTYSVFTRSTNTSCGRCQEQRAADLEVSGQTLLTVALVERYLAGELSSLQPDRVVPYLQRNLHWRVTYANGTAIDRAEVDGVLVSVISNEVTLPTDPHQLPVYAQAVHVYPEITTKPDNQTPRGEGTGLTQVGQA